MSTPRSKNSSLMVLRIIWAVLIFGEINFAGIIIIFLWPHHYPAHLLAAQRLTIIGAILLVVWIPLAFFLRQLIYRAGPDGTVQLHKYLVGNIVFYAMCESVAFTGLISMQLHGGPGGEIIVPALAIALQLVNYPAGNQTVA